MPRKQPGWNTKIWKTKKLARGKLRAIQQRKPLTSSGKTKSTVGGKQHFANFLQGLSENIERMRQLSMKKTEWKWTDKKKKILTR